MNIHHPTAAEQARKARELREKFYGKPNVTNRAAPAPKPQEAKQDMAEQIARLEDLLRKAMEVSDVLRAQLEEAHKTQPVGTLKEKVLTIIQPVLERHGVSFQQIISKNRSSVYMQARRDAWKAAYESLPTHSLNELSVIFNYHYTTISDAARSGGWDHSQRLQTRPRKAGEGSR